MPEAFDPYLNWLGIRDPERPPNHYRLLGVELFEGDTDVILHAADRQMAHVRTFQSGRHALESQRLLNELAAAKLCLLSPERKAAYDAQLRGRPTAPPVSPPPPPPGAGAARLPAGMPPVPTTAHAATAGPPVGPTSMPPVPPPASSAGPPAPPRAAQVHPTVRPDTPALPPESPPPGLSPPVEPDRPVEPRPTPGLPRPAPRSAAGRRSRWLPRLAKLVIVAGIALAAWMLLTARPEGRRLVDRARAWINSQLASASPEAAPGADTPEATAPGGQQTAGGPSPGSQPTTKGSEHPRANPGGAGSVGSENPGTASPGTVSAPGAPPGGPSPGAAPGSAGSEGDEAPADPNGSATSARLAVPDAAAQAVALREVRSLFADRYDGARRAADKRSLAALLYQKGVETRDDDTARYVLLVEAREMAIDAGDAALVQKSLEAISRLYGVDLFDASATAYRKAAYKMPEASRDVSLAHAAMRAARRALGEHRFQPAAVMAEAARDAARKARDTDVITEAVALMREVAWHEQAFAEYVKAEPVLAVAPDDPAANLAVGRYLCFAEDRWAEGLPHLAKGDDTELARLGQSELAAPSEPTAMVELGDRWWEAADQASPEDRPFFQARGRFWYRKALPGLSGLTETRVRQRLGQSGP